MGFDPSIKLRHLHLHLHLHPHPISGGQRQLVAIARPPPTRPKLPVLVEPTGALDATVQTKVLDPFERLKQEHTLLFLDTYSLAIVDRLSREAAVISKGPIVEQGEY